MFVRAAGAWLLAGLPVIAARVWWSAAAAIFVVTVALYVTAVRSYMHRHRPA